MQMFQLILFVVSAEFRDPNIYYEEAAAYTPEDIMVMVDQLKEKGFKNLIIFNDKNPEEFNQVEAKLLKALEKAQFRLENPDESEGENMIGKKKDEKVTTK